MDLVGIAPGDHWNTMLDVAKRIEKGGYESIWVYDHFHTVPDATQEPTYEAWTLMAALAAATSTARLGQMCTCNSYRPPSYLAKVAASVDAISGGRLEFAIGAGWYEEEYLAYGYPFPSGGARIAQLEEGVEIIKAMWTEDAPTYKGEHYQIDGAICRPKPLQDPHPPIWIAGGGERKTLRVVAKHAAYANFAAEPEHFKHKSEVLAGHCEAIGRDYAEIGRTAILHAIVGSTTDELDSKVEMVAAASGRDTEWVWKSFFIGTPEKVANRLGELKELGCVHVQAYFPDAAWGDSLDLFDAEVIPALR
jgi:F420-dependent oxidoreductase-like protein